jgi:hypothetical protein
LSLLNEFGEPSIVNVAAEITSFDMLVPETRNQNCYGNQQDQDPTLLEETARNLKYGLFNRKL